ncbi:MAG: 50S ribosomal protein L17 [Alphaproteobacteria bacterium]|jgi:large subunit ribosomal protein L17|nr:50S ribosomal protein L17 [Alphaproteobacteria bacterium]
MRHKIAGRKLNRKSSHRISLLKNLSKSLIRNEQIETTLPKAKDLRPFVEKLLHRGKKNDLHSRRKVYNELRDMTLVNKIFDTLAKRYSKRNGGYVRILKSGYRYGDASPKAIIELIDRDENAKGLSDKIRLKEKQESDGKSKDVSADLETSIKPKTEEKKTLKAETQGSKKETETKK